MFATVLVLLAPAAWGGGACAVPVGTPAFFQPGLPGFPQIVHPAPVIIRPAEPAPAPLDDRAVEAAVRKHLGPLLADAVERRLAIEAEKKKLAKASEPCVGGCNCSKNCGERCPCREGQGRCGDGCTCVVAGPPERPAVTDLPPTGVDWDRISPKDRYEKDGKECSRSGVINALAAAGDSLTDDSAKPFLTVVGDEAFRKKVLADLAASPLAAKAHVQAYAADHWVPRDRGLAPGVWLQKRDGTKWGAPVAADKYSTAALNKLVARLDPSAKPDGKPGGGTVRIPGEWLILAALAALILTRRSQ